MCLFKEELIYFYSVLLLCCAKQQNIVLIISDDVGWNDASFHGSNQIPTPNIDALAYNGIILNRFYTQPSCSPSRAALLTGKYPIRLGFQGMPLSSGQNRHLPFDTDTLPKKLKDLGYKTYLIGKWHLGAAFKNVTPTGMGFDYHFGYWNGFIGYRNHYARWRDNMMNETILEGLDMHNIFEPMWATQGQYITDLLTQQAQQVILDQDGEKPFFLTIAHLAGHAGYNNSLEVPDEMENDIKFNYIKNPNRRLYAGIITELDKSVGKILKTLKEKGVLDNTLIVFISDNGAQTEGIHANSGSNWPLRGLKFSVHEGGIRNLAVMYSSQLKNKGINNELMHISDLMPTLYSAAGGDVSSLGTIDGVNHWNNLINNKSSSRSNLLINIDEVLEYSGLIGENGRYKIINGSAIHPNYDLYFGDSGRTDDIPQYNISQVLNSNANNAIGGSITEDIIKLLRQKADIGNCRLNHEKEPEKCTPNKFCLFDLYADPCEVNNIAAMNPVILNRLKGQLSYFWTQLKPQEDVLVDLKADPIFCNNTWFTWLDEDNKIEHC